MKISFYSAKRAIKINLRYILAFLVMLFVFFANKNFFQDFTITSEECHGGKCLALPTDSSLSDKNPVFYINDIVKTEEGAYYRLIFEEKVDSNTLVNISLAKATDEEMEIKSPEFKKSDDFVIQEIVFRASDKFSDLIFQKNNLKDNANIWVRNVNISKLNIFSEKKFASLTPSIIGKINVNQLAVSQIGSDKRFSQLKESNIILGQIFKAENDYISGVAFDIDVTKIDNRGGKKYRLELRTADWDGKTAEIKKEILSSLSFTIDDLEKYRQNDGKIRFPMLSQVEPGRTYFIGINNDHVETDRFNYLTMKGSSDSKYESGTSVIKRAGQTYQIGGDLCFSVYGAEYKKIGNERVLAGAVIEDIGLGQGMYIYKTSGFQSDFTDLESHSMDIKFNEGKNVISGSTNNSDSYIMYKFNTIYPFKRITFNARLADLTYSNAKVFYSFDKDNWQEVPESFLNKIQIFNYTLDNKNLARKEIYFKITFDPNDPTDAKSYGLSNLKIEGELIMK